jgi:hypothetical protein
VTVFDTPALPAELRKVGIRSWAKVVASAENAELCKKYSAGPNTLVLCAPNGDKLMAFAGPQCTQTTVCSGVKQFPAFLAAWKARQK